MTLACTFEGGKCVHCGATTRINSEWGECQGWNEPIISDKERELTVENWRLQSMLPADYVNKLEERQSVIDGLRTANIKQDAALRLALEALQKEAAIYREDDPEDGAPEHLVESIIAIQEVLNHG